MLSVSMERVTRSHCPSPSREWRLFDMFGNAQLQVGAEGQRQVAESAPNRSAARPEECSRSNFQTLAYVLCSRLSCPHVRPVSV